MKLCRIILAVCVAACLFCGTRLAAQSPDSQINASKLDSLVARAGALRKAYDFAAAAELCGNALAQMPADSAGTELLEDEMVLAQNGAIMRDFCLQPTVVAKYNFPLDEFFLYYPMAADSWRPTPAQLDALAASDPLSRAMYAPFPSGDLYFCAHDEAGVRNIYHTHLKDTLWTRPRLINETLTSSADEVFPWLSPDGKNLYFSSRGLYGMGGFDIYVSAWDEAAQDWGAPVNLGFPFSSPYDDFLYVNSDDGQYTVFASNRECTPDSVTVYVLEYESLPVRKKIESASDLRSLCQLEPRTDRSKIDSGLQGRIQEDENVRKYVEAMDKVRTIRDSIGIINSRLDMMRASLKSESEEARETLMKDILATELSIPQRQKQLSEALGELRKIEMDFLSNGIVIDPDQLREEADREVVGTSPGYVFSKARMGEGLAMTFEEPEPSFDYSFQLLDRGQFALDNTLPPGLVYQIQIFTTSRLAGINDLKGLSPVFERLIGPGRRAYSAGLFRSYDDVLANLNVAKKAGFRGAMIVAFNDGEQVSIPEARELESKVTSLYVLRLFPGDGEGLNENVLEIIHAWTDKDISRSAARGESVFEIGPFRELDECEQLRDALSGSGLRRIAIVRIDE